MKTSFIFTVDVETRTHGESMRDVMGVLPGCPENAGLGRMMDMLDAHGAKGTFFFNVYEITERGDDVMAAAVRLVHSRGHDVELHTHPSPMYRYYGMSQAPLEDQIAILRRGMALIEAWTGKAVVAHRAGAFAANADTLRAARAVGLRADCSLSPGSHVPCRLVSDLGASNRARRADDVWEIPMTWFDQLRLGPWRSRRILDIEGCSLAEIEYVARWAMRHKVPTVCILMHSFSFLRKGWPNRRVVQRFAALLDWLREQSGIEVQTVESACDKLTADGVPAAGVEAPATGPWLTWRRAVGAWNDGWKNMLVSAAGFCLFGVLVLILIYLSRMAMQ